MEYKVAPSYQNWTIEEINENTRKAYVTSPCPKCGGSGQFAWFGVCFTCNGHGYIGKWVKVYSVPEYEKYIAAQERAKERKAQKEQERVQALKDNSEENKNALLEKFGFDVNDPAIYLVSGNTYEIKDELKERGARFNPELNWYFNRPTEVPEGHELIKVPFDDVYEWLPMVKRIELKENAKKVAAAARISVKTDSKSEWIGEEKQRMRDLKVVLTGARAVSSAYGTSILFTFDQGDNKLAWFTSCPPDEDKAIVGHEYLLTGTVKKHDERDGVKQTLLNRCILKEI